MRGFSSGGLTGFSGNRLTSKHLPLRSTFSVSFALNYVIDMVVGQRVGAKAELEGLDLPEMGQLGYPEFELKARPIAAQV